MGKYDLSYANAKKARQYYSRYFGKKEMLNLLFTYGFAITSDDKKIISAIKLLTL